MGYCKAANAKELIDLTEKNMLGQVGADIMADSDWKLFKRWNGKLHSYPGHCLLVVECQLLYCMLRPETRPACFPLLGHVLLT